MDRMAGMSQNLDNENLQNGSVHDAILDEIEENLTETMKDRTGYLNYNNEINKGELAYRIENENKPICLT